MSNIEPTEEQRQAANQWLEATDHCPVNAATENALAHLLAEREAKLHREYGAAFSAEVNEVDILRAGLARIIEAVHVQMAATALPQPLIDVVRGVYAEHPYALHRIEDLEKVCHALQEERDTLQARVAELEAVVANSTHDQLTEVMLEAREAQHLARIAELEQLDLDRDRALYLAEGEYFAASAREAQHLADIKALHQFLGDHEEEEGIWIPRSEFKDVPCRKYLDDAKCPGFGAKDCDGSCALTEAERDALDDAKAAEGGEG